MPNHVKNRLIIKAEESRIKEIVDFLKGEPDEDGTPCHMDFNKIVPMPEELRIKESSDGDMGLAILQQTGHAGRTCKEVRARFDELEPEEQAARLKLGQKYLDNKKKYGHKTWYDWNLDNWGTKWNAYNQKMLRPNEIWFDTAWSGVIRLVHKLSQIFPDATFEYTYADEDTGANCGVFVLQNGEGEMLTPDNGTKEAYEIAFEMRPEIQNHFHFDGKTYRYKEEC